MPAHGFYVSRWDCHVKAVKCIQTVTIPVSIILEQGRFFFFFFNPWNIRRSLGNTVYIFIYSCTTTSLLTDDLKLHSPQPFQTVLSSHMYNQISFTTQLRCCKFWLGSRARHFSTLMLMYFFCFIFGLSPCQELQFLNQKKRYLQVKMSLGPSVTLQCIAIVHKLFSSAMNNSSLELFFKFLIIRSETRVTGGVNFISF